MQLFAALSAIFISREMLASELLLLLRPPSNNIKANTRAASNVARWSSETGKSWVRMSRVTRFHSVKPSASRSWCFETARDERLLGNPLICSWSCVCRFNDAGPDGCGVSLLRAVAEKADERGLLAVPAVTKVRRVLTKKINDTLLFGVSFPRGLIHRSEARRGIIIV